MDNIKNIIKYEKILGITVFEAADDDSVVFKGYGWNIPARLVISDAWEIIE